MAVYACPAYPCATQFGMQMAGNVMINQSPLNKAVQRVEFPGDLWIVRAEFPPVSHAEFGPLEAFWNRFRGIAHTLRIWHLLRPVPRGTMRGFPSLSIPAAEGANIVRITVASGETLIAGDMLSITLATGFPQLVQVCGVEVLGSTTLLVDIVPPLRRNALTGATVSWDKPWVDCMVTSPPFLTGVPVVSSPFSIEAIEVPT